MKKGIFICTVLVIAVVLFFLFSPKALVNQMSDIQEISVYVIEHNGNRTDVTEKIDSVKLIQTLQQTKGSLQIEYQPYHLTADVHWEIEVIGNQGKNFFILLGSVNYKYSPSSGIWIRYHIKDPSEIISLLETVNI